jgi:hypothetical protein
MSTVNEIGYCLSFGERHLMNVPLLLESEEKRIEAVDYLERLSSVDGKSGAG